MSPEADTETQTATETEKPPAHELEVRRSAGLPALLGVGASALAIAYVARALSTGAWLDWAFGVLLVVLGVSQLLALVDARTPLLVADPFGIRLRLGREWRGLPWSALEQVVVEPRTSLVRDGRLVVAPRHLHRALEGYDARARRQVAWNQRLHGAPLVVPLGVTTRTTAGTTADLVAELAELSAGRAAVVQLAGYVAEPVETGELLVQQRERRVEREQARIAATTSTAAEAHQSPGTRVLGRLATLVSRMGSGRDHDVDADDAAGPRPTVEVTTAEVTTAAATPAQVTEAVTATPALPARDARPASRVDVRLETAARGNLAARLDTGDADRTERLPEIAALRRGDDAWVAAPEEPAGTGPTTIVIDDYATQPAVVPVVGPQIADARRRLGLTTDQLSTRTRIQPHVLEAIEVDDFEPCGGDFYARGHLRALALVLGLDGPELLAEFDARYASAPINARRVFEAELATGLSGGIRTRGGGPRWGLMLGVVLTLVLAWGVARLLTDEPAQVTSPAPALDGSAGVAADQSPITSSLGTPVPMTVRAVRGPSDVMVRDHHGRILWAGHLDAGQGHRSVGVGPFAVRASSPAMVDVWVDGKARGAVGTGEESARRTFR